jgi:hypothetical protein
MASFKAVSLFLLGMLAGVGVATVVAAHIEPGEMAVKFGVLNIFQAGVLLLVIGLAGGIEVTKGQRPRRLRTIMVGIALLAFLLAVSVGLRRRAERFKELQLQYQKQYQTQSSMVPDDPQDENFGPLLRQNHWYNAMSQSFRRASSRPWLSVPKPEPCTCPVCKGHPW